MTNYYHPRVPWLIVATVSLICLLVVACIYPCHDYYTNVYIRAEGFLVIDDAAPDSSQEYPSLRIELWQNELYHIEYYESPLVYVDGKGLSLSHEIAVEGNGWNDTDDIQLEDFTMSFALVQEGTGEPWDDAFPTIEAHGGTSRAVLWNGWTLLLDWAGVTTACK